MSFWLSEILPQKLKHPLEGIDYLDQYRYHVYLYDDHPLFVIGVFNDLVESLYCVYRAFQEGNQAIVHDTLIEAYVT